MEIPKLDRQPDIVNMMFGSHLYGLNTPDSDIDYKGIYLPNLRELVLGKYPQTCKGSTGTQHAKNEAGDIDVEVVSLPRFIELAIQGETFAIDMLHCDKPMSSSWVWDYLVQNRRKFYSKSMKAYIGYVRKQAAKYGLRGTRLASIKGAIDSLCGIEYCEGTLAANKDLLFYGEFAEWVTKPSHIEGKPDQEFYRVNEKMYQSTSSVEYVWAQLDKVWSTYGARAKAAQENEGVDWKAMSHALRAGYQARDIYMHGDFNYPLEENEFLLKVKQGKLDYKTEVAPVLEELVDEVNALSDANTFLPEKVDSKFWDNWLIDVYSSKFDINLTGK